MWWYVYFLKSLHYDKIYIGSTNSLERRVDEHNKGLSQSTKAFLPWQVESFIAVKSETSARALEKYFKTGSGIAILKKRILNYENKFESIGDEALA